MSDTDWGIKISKEGESTDSTDPRDLLMSSKYPMLKYHSVEDTTITFTPGDSEQYADIPHTLGYVPAFIPYAQDLDDPTKLRFIGATPPTSFGLAYWAYADSTKIRVGLALVGFDYNSSGRIEPPSDYWNTFSGTNEFIYLGNVGGSSTNGALRFEDVTIPQGETIIEAILGYMVGSKGAGVGDLKAIIYGIDEGNTGAFSSSPMLRTRTTAFDQANWSLPSAGNYSLHNITSIVQEIVDRGDWASGNAMGFILNDDSSPNDVYAFDAPNGSDSYLEITYGSNTTLKFRVIIFKDKIA